MQARYRCLLENDESSKITIVSEVLSAVGTDLSKVVKVTLYVIDINILKELNPLYVTYFSNPFPVREAVCVKELPLGAQIEMSVVASL